MRCCSKQKAYVDEVANTIYKILVTPKININKRNPLKDM